MLKRILYPFCACALLIGLAGAISAAPVFPPTQENIDTLTLSSRIFTNMVDHNSDLLVDEGLSWLNSLAVIALVLHALVETSFGSLESFGRKVAHLVMMFVIYHTMLVNYNTPLPLSDGQSFHRLF